MIGRSRGWIERHIAWPLLCALVFTIPWEKSIFVPGVGTITRLVGLMVLAAAVAAALERRSVRAGNAALVLAGVFVTWASLTYFWSVAPGATAQRAQTFLQLAAMLWLIWDLCRTPEQQAWLMRAYVGGAAVTSWLTLIRYAQGQQTYYRRYAALGFEPNDLGLTVALALPLAMYLALTGRGWLRWAYRVAAALAIAALLLSASRTAFVAAIVAFGFAVWTWRESDGAQRIANAALLALLVLGALYLAPPASRQRLATLPAEATKGTLHDRTNIWKAGLQVFRHYPVRGAGLGAFPEAARPWLAAAGLRNQRYVAHNMYLSILAECGLIGFALYALWLLAQAVYVWMMPFTQRALWAVMLAVWAVGGLTLNWEHRKPGWLFFGLIMTEWARSFYASGGRKVKLRVLEVVATLKRAGAEQVAISLACGLGPTRFETAVVSLYDPIPGGLDPVLQERGIRVWRLGKQSGFDYRMWLRLARVLREFHPDVLHTHSYILRYTLPAALAVRVWAMVHTVHNLAGKEVDDLGRLVNRAAFSCGVLPVAVSAEVARSFRRTYGFEVAATIPNGIDVDRYFRPEARRQWRRAHGFADDDILIVSVARLEAQKDPLGLIQAFARWPAHDPRCHLLMAGAGSLESDARECARRHGVAGCVHFLGVCADVPELLSASDLFALASHWEGGPLAVIEAMAARLPVIATAVGAIPEMVEHGVAGILAPPGDIKALGVALATLARYPERRRAMGLAAGARAASFSTGAMVTAYGELFERVAGERR